MSLFLGITASVLGVIALAKIIKYKSTLKGNIYRHCIGRGGRIELSILKFLGIRRNDKTRGISKFKYGRLCL